MANKRINLDAVFKTAQLGLVNKSISQTLGGMRTGHRRLLTPSDRANQGYVFMTRPQINLTTRNISGFRPLFPLMNTDVHSLAAWIRGTLDPRWALVGDAGMDISENELTYEGKTFSSQVDIKSPFINVISNAVITVNGFPDIDAPTFTGEPNRIGASHMMTDGVDNLNMPLDITLTCRDMIGDPIYNLFRTLNAYQQQVYQGVVQRYPDFIMEDCIDYNVRLYRIKLSPDGEHIHSIASTYPGFVQGVAAGHKYDYSLNDPYEEDNIVSLRFMFSGAVYEDPVLLDDFNMTVMYANSEMKNDKKGMTRVPRQYLEYFSYERVYPFIDIDKYVLQWWATNETYARVMALVNYKTATILV